jgi:predicted GTPase
MAKERIIIMGAAGRDFHNFNTLYRDNADVDVVAFTATQIPNIDDRVYPAGLAGKLYPKGIPIIAEDDIAELLTKEKVQTAVFAYSDVPYNYVMQRAARVNSLGVDFKLIGDRATMLPSNKPVVAVCAVRTGSGKSQTTRRVSEILRERGLSVAVIRHPMPYGDLAAQAVQRFGNFDDLDKQHCTIEEREEYEHHLAAGNVVFAGVDYAAILEEAEKEADVILWDGGNNDLPFYRPDLWIVVADPHRPGHEVAYYPGETNLYQADVIIINKVNTADKDGIAAVLANIESRNPDAVVIRGASPITVEGDASQIRGKRVLCVEDGPTLTHGEMKYGAAVVAARENGAAQIVDPRPFAVGTIKETFEIYPKIGELLPAMGYGDQQIKDLKATIDATDVDLVLVGTPIDLGRVAQFSKPYLRVGYHLEEQGEPKLPGLLDERIVKKVRK